MQDGEDSIEARALRDMANDDDWGLEELGSKPSTYLAEIEARQAKLGKAANDVQWGGSVSATGEGAAWWPVGCAGAEGWCGGLMVRGRTLPLHGVRMQPWAGCLRCTSAPLRCRYAGVVVPRLIGLQAACPAHQDRQHSTTEPSSLVFRYRHGGAGGCAEPLHEGARCEEDAQDTAGGERQQQQGQ
jgi:hypothetical protein